MVRLAKVRLSQVRKFFKIEAFKSKLEANKIVENSKLALLQAL